MKLTKKLYDYKLNIPSDMLKQIDVQKFGEVDLFVQGNGIIITKKGVNYDFISKDLKDFHKIELERHLEENNKKIIDGTDISYNLKVSKDKSLYLPKSKFDGYNLSYKTYSVVYSYDSGVVNATLILSDKGNFKYRKDNVISMNSLFSNFKIDQGIIVKCNFNLSGNIYLEFKAEKKEEKINEFNFHHLLPKIEPKIEKDIKNLEQKDTFKVIIRKRYLITIPSELFNKYNLCRAKFNIDHDFKASKHILNLKFDNKGYFSFQKINSLPIKTLFGNNITLDIGKEVNCILTKDKLVIEYEDVKLNNEIDSNQDIEESDIIKEQLYLDKIEDFKRRNISFKFIEKKDLPKEKICFRCGNTLTNKDNSMFQSHRICNKCKTKKLRELFEPIRELSKLREMRKKND